MPLAKQRKKFVLDTSSLLELARCFLLFDTSGALRHIFEDLFAREVALLHEAVYDELVKQEETATRLRLGFLHAVPQIDSEEIDVSRQEYIMQNRNVKKQQIDKYSNSGDCQIMEFCLQERSKQPNIIHIVVSEERPHAKDANKGKSKRHMKIPDICENEGLRHMNIVEMLEALGIQAEFRLGSKGYKRGGRGPE